MSERDLTLALRNARTISNAWGRRLPWYRDEFVSACNLAIAQALRAGPTDDFDGLARCIMHRRCRDVYRERICNRGRMRPFMLKWAEEWVDTDKRLETATSAGTRFLDLAVDPWEPDDTGYLLGLVLGWLDDVERLGLASSRATTAVRLWLELGSMEAVAEAYGVTPSRICQLRREATDAIRGLAA